MLSCVAAERWRSSVERTGFEIRRTGNGTVGSNPTLSAIIRLRPLRRDGQHQDEEKGFEITLAFSISHRSRAASSLAAGFRVFWLRDLADRP